LAGLINAMGGWKVPAVVGFVALGIALVAAIRLAPRTAAGFAAILAFGYLAFFAFGRWAFGNYYWFVIACLCVAVAVVGQPDDDESKAWRTYGEEPSGTSTQ
jgi:hypothetical protein